MWPKYHSFSYILQYFILFKSIKLKFVMKSNFKIFGANVYLETAATCQYYSDNKKIKAC